MNTGCEKDEDMEYLMTAAPDIKVPRFEAFWNTSLCHDETVFEHLRRITHSIEGSASDIQDTFRKNSQPTRY